MAALGLGPYTLAFICDLSRGISWYQTTGVQQLWHRTQVTLNSTWGPALAGILVWQAAWWYLTLSRGFRLRDAGRIWVVLMIPAVLIVAILQVLNFQTVAWALRMLR